MQQTDNIKSRYLRFRSTIMNRMASPEALEAEGLVFWRVRILFVILFSGLLIGTLTLLPVVLFTIKEKMWVLLIFDLFIWLTSAGLLFSRRLRYDIRAAIGSLILYLVGVFILISLGPMSGGPVWLFSFPILMGVFFESKAAMAAILLNAVTLTVIGLAIISGAWGRSFPFFISLESMVVAVAIFLLFDTICSLSVTTLVKGLVSANRKEKNLIRTLEMERSQLLTTKNRLELEVDERKQAEKALHASEERYRALFENSLDCMFLHNFEGRFIDANPAALNLLGYQREDIHKLNLLNLMSKDDLKKGAEDLKIVMEKGYQENPSRYKLIKKNGETAYVESKGSLIYMDGRPFAVMGSARDITKRHHTEQLLLRSEKLASLGNMVAGVAHEISTPLAVAVMSASYLHDTTGEFVKRYRSGGMTLPMAEKYTGKITEASSMVLSNLNRASDLLTSFKNVAVDQIVEEKRAFNLKTNIEDTLSSLRPRYKRTSHTITVECPDDLTINSYPGAFSQIVTNLLINSLAHGFDGLEKGRVCIAFSKRGNRLLFTYSDMGKGMDTATLDKLFDPFFTTTRSKGGIGLGMHIVYNLVTKTLNGQIECKSSPGNGCEFMIDIPLA